MNDSAKTINPEAKGAGQYGLATMLLLLTTVAIWFAWWRTQNDVRQMERELPELRTAARELIVSDTTKFAVVKKPTSWLQEQTWEVYVPDGDTFALNLKFQDLSENDFAEPLRSVPIPTGIHQLQFLREKKSKDNGHVEVRVDGKTVFAEEHVIGRSSHRTFHHKLTETRTWAKHEPVLLFHLQYGYNPTDKETVTWDGVLIWIGQTASPHTADSPTSSKRP